MPSRTAASPGAGGLPEGRERILAQAREQFFAHGYSALTMDLLAAELGMSKKTLYVHFAGKDAIVRELIMMVGREIRAEAEALLADRRLSFAEKLRGWVESVVMRLASLDGRTMRDLQRFAPQLFALVEQTRGEHLPYIFGRFVEEGQLAGLVREDVRPAFAIEFFLHAMQGLMRPQTLERLALQPTDVLPQAIDLFFGGLLTNAGRKQHEKLFPR